MASLRESNNFRNNLIWPKHLSTPAELLQALSSKTRLRIMKSPIYSKVVLQFIGGLAYLLAHKLNTLKVLNHETFRRELKLIEENQLIDERESNNGNQKQIATTGHGNSSRSPLITLSNHISCIDDPVLWSALLPLTYFSTNSNSVRWSAAAVDICFSKPWHSAFFSLGSTFPIIRGAGIDQPAMKFAAGLLEHNQWVHLFPEGRVMRDDNQQVISNKDRGYLFKWGIAKMILDYFNGGASGTITKTAAGGISEKRLRILPFYHLGMDKVLPIGWPYIPSFGKRITVFIRPAVINMDSRLLDNILKSDLSSSTISKSKSDDAIKRIKLTKFLENQLEELIEPATKEHNKPR